MTFVTVAVRRSMQVSPLRKANIFAIACCSAFILLGSPWLDRPGIQTDEALFTAAVYPPFYRNDPIRIFGHDYGVMVMTYVGALKGHLWTPLLKLYGANPWTLRMPALILTALSIWFFYRLLLRSLGIRAAVIGTALLTFDPVYLLTARWDWGPVVLQHLMLLGGMLGIAAWYQTRKLLFLGLGFFAFGLGLWDKAIFAWSLVGLTGATIIVLPKVLIRSISVRTVAVATLAFAAGAFPFIRYNIRQDWVTFRSNAQRSNESVAGKFAVVKATFDGSALFGSIMREPHEGPVRQPSSTLERIVVATTNAARHRRTHLGWPLFLGSLLLLPLVWRTPARKAILFAIIFMAVTWGQMIPVLYGGGGAHHTILLWPMPQLAIAAALAYTSLRWRFGAAAVGVVTAVACVAALLVTATHYTYLVRNGGAPAWTEALYPALDAIRKMQVQRVCVLDFGFYDNLRALLEGKPEMCVGDDPVTDEAKAYARYHLALPDTVFIAHTPDHEFDVGRGERHARFVRDEGYAKTDRQVFVDRNGRPAIEIYRTIKLP